MDASCFINSAALNSCMWLPPCICQEFHEPYASLRLVTSILRLFLIKAHVRITLPCPLDMAWPCCTNEMWTKMMCDISGLKLWEAIQAMFSVCSAGRVAHGSFSISMSPGKGSEWHTVWFPASPQWPCIMSQLLSLLGSVTWSILSLSNWYRNWYWE